MRTLLVLSLTFLLSGCEKVIFDEGKYSTPEYVFEAFWQEVDRHYSFFPYLNLDWDSVYAVYKTKIHGNMSDDALFTVLSQMSYLLKDGHVNLFSKKAISNYTGWYDRYPLNQLNITRYLEGIKYPNNTLSYATIRSHNIGYIFIKTFSGETENFEVIDQILTGFAETKGIIIDVRSNGGGNSNNADLIASRFADKTCFIFKYRYRNGPSHEDFTGWQEKYLIPADSNRYTKPVIVLSNRRCYSSTEWFLAEMDALSHITIVGDTSGGGSGNPIQKQLPNGWMLRLSNSQKMLSSGRDYQYSGIFPDVPVWITPSDSAKGTDTILETAIGILENSMK